MEPGIPIAILGAIIAVYYDLREAIIPNRLVISMFLLSVPIAFLWGDPIPWVMNLLLAFPIAYIFWRLRIWSGGDSKLLIALAALIPANPGLGIFPMPQYRNFFFISIIANLLVIHIILILPLTLTGKIKLHEGLRLSPFILLSLLLAVFVGDFVGGLT
jgi:preflagellin peptidase FlaK